MRVDEITEGGGAGGPEYLAPAKREIPVLVPIHTSPLVSLQNAIASQSSPTKPSDMPMGSNVSSFRTAAPREVPTHRRPRTSWPIEYTLLLGRPVLISEWRNAASLSPF